ncbi:protein BPS1, chloroplastic-like [Carya illinoinensis]|uniref:BPS1-like protein n=1 Tax=Carya illinoinensis TaxID=32201 RepID=A0A8T1NEJ8_CARIL|nr:protein BPS1, chloroplastic-like [Carya illinoinensis]KAG6627534.1 hypothetical protein CIPAW_15G135600 [Carya illinoinensis]
MVLLVEKISKLYSKLENHHHQGHKHHQYSETLSVSLQAFQSEVSNCLNQLWLDSKPGSEILSLPWIRQCLALIPVINKAFAKLLVDIDFPVSDWEDSAVEEYLNYSLSLLGLFNSINSSLACFEHVRLSLAHALSLVENSPSSAVVRLTAIQQRSPNKDFKKGETKEEGKGNIFSGKQWITHQALIVVKSIGFWVCGIVLSGLSSDGKPYLEMRKLVGGLIFSSFLELDSSICEIVMEKGTVLKEIKELNDTVTSLVATIVSGKHIEAAEELQRELEVSEKLLEGLHKDVDRLFYEVIAGRNKLLNCLGHR